jgi:hypothetical protein
MKYKLTITMKLESNHSEERVAKKFASLFEFGAIKESIADALQLLNDPRLIAVSVQGKTRRAQR